MAWKNLLEWEISQIGIHNDSDGSNKYNEWYWGYRSTQPWCAVFQGYGFKEVGIYDRLAGLTGIAGCEYWREWAIKKGYWSTTPKVGSLVLYDWNPKTYDGADHIGIVESVFDGGIVAIEGNTSPNSSGSQIDGGYVARKTRYNNKIMGYIHVDTNAKRPEPKPIIGYSRYSGNDRYNTSKATANTHYDVDAVVVVSGKDFADALSASYFAKCKHCPIILSSKEMVDDTVRYIQGRTNIRTVYIIGGTGAIPEELETKLYDREIVRIAGGTRYETNLKVLEASDIPNKQLIIVSGQNFPDGLCAGMINRPVLLVNKYVKDEQIEFIKQHGLTRFYVFGGVAAVNGEVVKQLSELGEVSRYAGDNRYETSRIIAQNFFPSANEVIVASGKSFADGLSASNLGEHPLILADHGFTMEARKYMSNLILKKVEVVGGRGAISDNTVDWALTKLE